MHTYIHTYVRTYIHSFLHTSVHLCMYTVYMYTLIHLYIYTFIYTFIYIHIYIYIHTYRHTDIQTDRQTSCMHACFIYIYTHVYTHMYTCLFSETRNADTAAVGSMTGWWQRKPMRNSMEASAAISALERVPKKDIQKQLGVALNHPFWVGIFAYQPPKWVPPFIESSGFGDQKCDSSCAFQWSLHIFTFLPMCLSNKRL